MPRPPVAACLALGLLSACGTEVHLQPGEVRQGGVAVWSAGDPVHLVLGRTDGPGRPVPVAHTRGVHLVVAGVDGDRREHLLPFAEVHASGGELRARCAPGAGHRIEVVLRPTPAGDAVEVRVHDRVGSRNDLLEQTLEWTLSGDEPCAETWLPHRQLPDTVVGDRAWHLPLAFTRCGNRALGLVPDLQQLERERRLPQAFELTDRGRGIRHGLIAHRIVPVRDDRDDTVAFTRDGAEPVAVRGEDLDWGHRLHLDRRADEDRTCRAWWSRLLAGLAVPTLEHRTLREPFAVLLERVLAEAATARWTTTTLGGSEVGAMAADLARSTLGLEGADAWFTVRHQSLRTAFALDVWAEEHGRTAMRARVRAAVDLLLQAESRSGLFPAVLVLDPDSGRMPTSLTGPAGEAPSGHLRGSHAAWTGYWLVRLAERMPERRDEILERAAPAARFFLANQRRDGSIPVFYDTSFLAPRRGLLAQRGLEAGAIAAFLVAHGEAAGDDEVRRGAERLLAWLHGQLDRRGGLLDAEVLARAGHEAVEAPAALPGQEPRGSLGLLLAARAALDHAAAAPDDAVRRERAQDFLRALAAFQEVWSPPALDRAAVGGTATTNVDLGRRDPRQGIAAALWLQSYDAGGPLEHLLRGALALRAGLDAPPEGPGDLHWGRGTAAATAVMVRDTLGQGVVDVAGGTGVGLDALWVEGVELDRSSLSLRVLSPHDLGHARIVFRNLPDNDQPLGLQVNGEVLGSFVPSRLEDGVRVPVRRVPRLSFDPPGEFRAESGFSPRVRCSGPCDGLDVVLEWGAGQGPTEEVALEPVDGGAGTLWSLPDPLDLSGIPVDTTLRMRLRYGDGRWQRHVPAHGHHRVLAGTMDSLDPGDDDERHLGDAGASTVVMFADGREHARELAGEGSFTYGIPVPKTATRVELRIRMQGGARITSGDHLLHEDRTTSRALRELTLEVADRRLWQDGTNGAEADTLPLTFTAVRPEQWPLSVARIRYLASGHGARIAGTARTELEAPPPGTLRLLVVPVVLADTPLSRRPEEIEHVFFATDGYRLTPPPEPRRTAGSVAELIESMSGGITEVRGRLHETVALALEAGGLGGEGAGARLARAVLAEAGESPRDQDLVVAVVGDHPNLSGLHGRRQASEGDDPDVVVLPAREPDGSILASGRALAAVLSAWQGIDVRAEPRVGSPGRLALGAGAGHVPAGLLGDQLATAGWADAVVLPPRDHLDQDLPILSEDRAYFVLPVVRGFGRGRLVIEERRSGPGEPGMTGEGGTLLHWRFGHHSHRPWVALADGTRVRVRRWLLSPNRPMRTTPFEPADESDLFQPPLALDGTSTPSLATPQGEVPWQVSDLSARGGGRKTVSLEHLGVRILEQRVTWTTVGDDGTTSPLPEETVRPELGGMQRTRSGWILWPRPGGTVRGRIALGEPGPVRVFGLATRPQGAGTVHLRMARGTGPRQTTHLDLAMAPRPTGRSFEIDAVGSSEVLTLELAAPPDAHGPVVLEQLVALPLDRPRYRLPARTDAPAARPSSDGIVRSEVDALEVEQGGRVRRSTPVVLVPGGRVRVLANRPGSEPGDVTLTMRLRNLDGSTRHTVFADLTVPGGEGASPLVGLFGLPAEFPETALMELEVRGGAGATLSFQAVEFLR